MTQMIPLNLLTAGDNPRQMKDKEADKALVASLREHGLLQPLVVRIVEGDPAGAVYQVIAGNRRFAALKKIYGEDGTIAIPCIVRDASDTEALELALVENVIRENMTPVDQYEAMVKLVAAGVTEKEIAKRFSMKDVEVQRMLALGALHPDCLAAWRKGKIDYEYACALTMAGAERQPQLMKEFPSEWTLRRALTDKALTFEHAKFTRDEYEAAGGKIITDLFSEPDVEGEDFDVKTYADPAVFWKLQQLFIDSEVTRLREDGWGDVIVQQGDYIQRWQLHDRVSKKKKAERVCIILKRTNGEIITYLNCARDKKHFDQIQRALAKNAEPAGDDGEMQSGTPGSEGPDRPEDPTLSGALIHALSIAANKGMVEQFSKTMTIDEAMAAFLAMVLTSHQNVSVRLGDLARIVPDEHPVCKLFNILQDICGKKPNEAYFLSAWPERRQAIYSRLVEMPSRMLRQLFIAVVAGAMHYSGDGKTDGLAGYIGFGRIDPLRDFKFDEAFWSRTTKRYMENVAEQLACKGWMEGNVRRHKVKDAASMMAHLFADPGKVHHDIKVANYSGFDGCTREEMIARVEAWRPEGFGVMEALAVETTNIDEGDDDDTEEATGAAGDEAA